MAKVAPSILSADFSKLGADVQEIGDFGADYIHVDVMDGAFVPNISFGAGVMKSLNSLAAIPYDVHLMIEDPDRYIEDFVTPNTEFITVHQEACRHLDRTIEKESDVIPVVLKDGEVQAGRSSVANRERFARLSQFVHRKLKEAGQEILDGEIGVEPYKNGQRTACDYCPYHAVCGFDRKTSGYEFNRWKNRKTEEIWEEICKEQQ